MTNPIQNRIGSNLIIDKLHNSILDLSKKLNTRDYSSIASAVGQTLTTFRDFFTAVETAEFEPELFYSNDTPRSEVYNKNILSIYNDLKRFYDELRSLNEIQVNSYNFAQILTKELVTRADELASTVLDLSILNNFDRGDVIVAGDDFKNSDYIDFNVGTASTPVDFVFGSNGITLGRSSSQNLVNESTEIEIIPLLPIGTSGQVNTTARIRNIERFYEGNYYNYLGLARPEGGGEFNFQFFTAPSGASDPPQVFSDNNNYSIDVDLISSNGAYLEIGASRAAKAENRKKMIDGNPSTFWECEYIYEAPDPLLEVGLPSITESTTDNPTPPDSQVVTIDLEEAEKVAKQYDQEGRDLVVDVILTFPEEQKLNIATINPLVFGSASFPEVLDIATASESDGTFKTVDGWNSLRFARTITPEANEYIPDSQLSSILAPSRGAYRGQGIYPFPPRDAKKIKFRLKMATPVPSVYERIYVLLKNDVEITTTTKTTTKKGLFA